MRPLTEALLRGNAEALTKKGWRPIEQRRCFKKVDTLLDYISQIKPGEYVDAGWHKKMSSQRALGLKDCLEEGMPSKNMQIKSLEALHTLLLLAKN